MAKYSFNGKIWKYKGPAAWHFVTLPKTLAKKIRKKHGSSEEGWGRLKGTAQISKTKWKTAIWYDTKARSYILPVKASVRKAAEIKAGSSVKLVLHLSAADTDIIRVLGNR